MSRKRDFRRLFRGLRFRLTISYAVLFTLLLTGVALAFRARLAAKLDDQLQEELNADWGAMKGYMRIEPVLDFGNKICAAWYYDADDPDETTIVLDTRKIYLVADQFGNPIPDSVTHEPSVSTAMTTSASTSRPTFARRCWRRWPRLSRNFLGRPQDFQRRTRQDSRWNRLFGRPRRLTMSRSAHPIRITSRHCAPIRGSSPP